MVEPGVARASNVLWASAPHMRHTDFRKNHEFAAILMHDRQFHHFIIITNIVPVEHDAIIRREHALGDPLA